MENNEIETVEFKNKAQMWDDLIISLIDAKVSAYNQNTTYDEVLSEMEKIELKHTSLVKVEPEQEEKQK